MSTRSRTNQIVTYQLNQNNTIQNENCKTSK